MRDLTIGLIGNPNVGKTTLFNQLTGSRQRVGNWTGVTVERKEGYFVTAHQQIKVVDLPGIYSLTSISAQTSVDEQIACQSILSTEIDLLLNVIDAANLERNLYLTLQLRELGTPCIVVLNMLDTAQKQHIEIAVDVLATALGCPIIPMVSTRASGITALKAAIDHQQTDHPPTLINYPTDLQCAIEGLTQTMPASSPEQQRRWLALQMLEGDIYSTQCASEQTRSLLQECHARFPAHRDPALLIADARYQAIAHLCEISSNIQQTSANQMTKILDCVILNRWLGVPLFLLVMYLMFVLSINFGGALQPLFSEFSTTIFINGMQWLGYSCNFPQWLILFMAQGLGGGINTVVPLIPQIGLMYLFLCFLEDSGYMARAAFVMDRLMQSLGLPGKSFVPLIVGFGCNVPAILGARTLDSSRERIITIIMAPFMSCGARLAIFALFSTAFFGSHGAWMVFSLYLLGISVAIVTALILKYTIMRGEASPFVMELPVYHIPLLRNLLLQTWQRLKTFILRAGKVIVTVSIFIGGLNSFSFSGKPVDRVNDSALASMSKVITPLLYPMGISEDNWPATVGLISGTMAKEVVVGTLNTLYTAENITQQPFDYKKINFLSELKASVATTGKNLRKIFTLTTLSNPIEANKGEGEMSVSAMGMMSSKFGSISAAYSYLIFVLLYVPCVSVLGAITRESSRGWMIFSILWGLNAAYSLATLFYQIANFSLQPHYSALVIGVVISFNSLLIFALRRASTPMITSAIKKEGA